MTEQPMDITWVVVTLLAILVAQVLWMVAWRIWSFRERTETPSAPSGLGGAKEPVPPAEERLVPGPILAVRGWRFQKQEWTWSGDVPLLIGVGVYTPWTPGDAERAPGSPHAPDRGGNTGFWGLRFKEDIPSSASVGGIVALWGKIIEHERGWRAEYAYPVVIWPNLQRPTMPGFPRHRKNNQLDVVVPELAALYGVPCLDAPPWCGGELVEAGAEAGSDT